MLSQAQFDRDGFGKAIRGQRNTRISSESWEKCDESLADSRYAPTLIPRPDAALDELILITHLPTREIPLPLDTAAR